MKGQYKILVDQFMLAQLFGSGYKPGCKEQDMIQLAIDRAYRDFCRTIRNIKDIGATKDATTQCIKLSIENLCCNSRDEYDEWHKSLCAEIEKKGYTFGQAQKWVNMTMKYLMVLDYSPVFKYIDYLHVPIDTIVIENAIDKGIIEPKDRNCYLPWSTRLYSNNDNNNYVQFQSIIRQQVEGKHISPIEWEFGAWNESTKR